MALTRREHPRFLAKLALSYTVPDPDWEPGLDRGSGEIQDIGRGGAQLELPEVLDPGTPIQVRFQAGTWTLGAEAKVAWSLPRPAQGSPRHGHGISFVEFAPGDREHLDAYLGERFRTGARFRVRIPVTCVLKEGTPPRIIAGTARDISTRGVRCLLSAEVPVGAALTLRLEIRGWPGTMEARVVWREPDGESQASPPYRHGLAFVGSQEHRTILDLVMRHYAAFAA